MYKLNDKQKRFALEYLKDLNATQAAIRAGYSEKTAYSIGQRLLKNVEIKALIEEEQKKVAEKTGLSAEWVVVELMDLVRICKAAVPVMRKEGKELVETGEYKIDSFGANKALELLGRHLDMFGERTPGDTNITLNLNQSLVMALHEVRKKAELEKLNGASNRIKPLIG